MDKARCFCTVNAPRYERKMTSVAVNIFFTSLMTNLTLTLNDPHDDAYML